MNVSPSPRAVRRSPRVFVQGQFPAILPLHTAVGAYLFALRVV
jgi:hypothetical protein